MKYPVYQGPNNYHKKWGISWLYRWIDSQEKRLEWMYMEPDLSQIENLYDKISQSD